MRNFTGFSIWQTARGKVCFKYNESKKSAVIIETQKSLSILLLKHSCFLMSQSHSETTNIALLVSEVCYLF